LRGAAGALIELDRDLMKLLVRRSVLVSRIRGGRDYAASPEAVLAEKDVRIAWENGALAFSKDPRFTRQLFTLLQDLKVLSKEQAEQTGIFTLVPSAKPVSGELTGPADTRMAQMYTALAACRGDALSLEALSLSEALIDTVKACSQAGAAISRHGQGAGPGGVSVTQGAPLSFAGKTIYVGEDFFTLYLMAFLAVGRPGACRLAGGARLKGADLSVLRQTLPLFGARLAPVVPRSRGLPVSLESSGAIPPQVLIPADLPLEAVCALLLAPLLWNAPVIFNLAALPASVAAAALAEVGAVHLACGAHVETRGAQLSFSPGALQAYERPSLSLDSSLCAYLLALPAFAGGSLSLKGSWPAHLPVSLEVESLLSWAGLAVRILGTSVSVEAACPPFSVPLQCNGLSPQLGPLFLALAAKRCMFGADTPSLRRPAPFPSDDAQDALAQEFYERIGLLYADGCVSTSDTGGRVSLPAHAGAAKTGHSAWTSPDAYWSMAFALAAFLRPGLRLANPGSVTEVLPGFWSIYNSLPHPADPVRRTQAAAQESKNDKPARRRVIAD
jgi:5-enolpyruvylshikimate-3-phosphate synthase